MTGYYAAISQDPLEAFAIDVTAALETYRTASRQLKTEFAASLAEKKGQDLADVALATLESLMEKHKGLLAERAKRLEDGPKADSAAGDGQAEGPKGESELDRTEQTIVDDLSRCDDHTRHLLPPHARYISLCMIAIAPCRCDCITACMGRKVHVAHCKSA